MALQTVNAIVAGTLRVVTNASRILSGLLSCCGFYNLWLAQAAKKRCFTAKKTFLGLNV